MSIPQILLDFITDHNGSGEAVNLLAIIAMSGFLAFAFYKKETTSLLEFASSSVIIIGAAAGSSRLKNGATPVEPK